MGPTVCELEGPIPILKISKMLVFTPLPEDNQLSDGVRNGHRLRFTAIREHNHGEFLLRDAQDCRPEADGRSAVAHGLDAVHLSKLPPEAVIRLLTARENRGRPRLMQHVFAD